MQSGKQKRGRIKARRSRKARKIEEERERKKQAARKDRLRREVIVNIALLAPTNSYGVPDFHERGYYVDKTFVCKDCGKTEVWTATQQKWWYEVAKGDVWTTAIRCRPCRRKERKRKQDARKIHEEGLKRKSHRHSAV